MGCGDVKLSKYLTQTCIAHCNVMICQQVMWSGQAEWPKVADAVIEAELSGKYSVTLYELLESVANKEVPELRASVDELRQWLKVPEGKLLRWQDLRRYVLEPAVKQINDNPTGAGFRVRMLVVKASRAITGV